MTKDELYAKLDKGMKYCIPKKTNHFWRNGHVYKIERNEFNGFMVIRDCGHRVGLAMNCWESNRFYMITDKKFKELGYEEF